MKKTYTGSCHCGAVCFEADLDFEKGSGKCNCSICAKTRNWGMLAMPADFRALSGESELTDYRFGEAMHHLFCRRCGVRPYGRGFLDFLGGEFYSVNLACLDGVSDAELAAIAVQFYDGRNNNWNEAPQVTGHL